LGQVWGQTQGMTLFAPPADAESSPKTLTHFLFHQSKQHYYEKALPSRTEKEREGQGTTPSQECAKNETDYITDPLAEWPNS
jgi:hypothetical protein